MGGIRLSESEQLLLNTSLTIRFFGILSLPLWAIGTAVVALYRRGGLWKYEPTAIAPARVGWDLRIFAACTLVIWTAILPQTQPAQQLRWQVERDLRTGRIAEGLALMSRHEQADFPPHWDPPPRVGFGERFPEITSVQEQLRVASVKLWVRKVYAQKFGNSLRGADDFMGVWGELTHKEVERRLALIEEMSERDQIIRDQADGLRLLVGDNRYTSDLQERIRMLLAKAGIPPSEIPPNSQQSQ
jgi:hypothetical protein